MAGTNETTNDSVRNTSEATEAKGHIPVSITTSILNRNPPSPMYNMRVTRSYVRASNDNGERRTTTYEPVRKPRVVESSRVDRQVSMNRCTHVYKLGLILSLINIFSVDSNQYIIGRMARRRRRVARAEANHATTPGAGVRLPGHHAQGERRAQEALSGRCDCAHTGHWA